METSKEEGALVGETPSTNHSYQDLFIKNFSHSYNASLQDYYCDKDKDEDVTNVFDKDSRVVNAVDRLSYAVASYLVIYD